MRATTLVPMLMFAVATTACSVDVREQARGDQTDVDIRSPLGNVSVRTNREANTGLAVYPGARPLRDERETQSANVSVGNSLFHADVVAAKFESDATAETIAAFYRNELEAYGAVVECRNDIDFTDRGPRCRGQERGNAIQLAAGNKNTHRVVVLTPRTRTTEIAIVYVSAGDRS